MTDDQSGSALLGVLVLSPVIMQCIRTFWPARLNTACSRFKGIYRRYHVDIRTGSVEAFQEATDSRTIGSVTADIWGSSATIHDRRTTFTNTSTRILLADANGHHSEVVTINMDLMLRRTDLVSVAQLRHGRRSGYVVALYNHTTNLVYQENLRRGQFVAKGGLAKMVMRLPVVYQVVLFLLIVTIPLMIVLGVGAQLQLRWFRRHGSKPLIRELQRRGQQVIPVAPAAAVTPPPSAVLPLPSGPVPAPPSSPAGWHADPTGRHQQRYWDGQQWSDHVADGGQMSTDPTPGSASSQ